MPPPARAGSCFLKLSLTVFFQVTETYVLLQAQASALLSLMPGHPGKGAGGGGIPVAMAAPS